MSIAVERADIDSGEGWPVSFEGDSLDYEPIPRSWLTHEQAYDRRERAGPKLLAVSAATYGSKALRVRYVKPANGKVLVTQTGADDVDGVVVPQGLLWGTGWPRSLRPGPSNPIDKLRKVEREHLEALWSDIVDLETLRDVPHRRDA